MKRRSRLEILIEILESSTEDIKPSGLMTAANLSWQPMIQYIGELKSKGLIEEIEIEEKERKKDKRLKIKYRTTIKGTNIVRTFNEVKKVVG